MVIKEHPGKLATSCFPPFQEEWSNLQDIVTSTSFSLTSVTFASLPTNVVWIQTVSPRDPRAKGLVDKIIPFLNVAESLRGGVQ